MNAFEELLSLPEAEKERLGAVFTPREIAQQPEVWLKVPRLLESRRGELLNFMDSAGLRGDKKAHVILTGAGSSEFIGNAVKNLLRKLLSCEVMSIPTTHLVTHTPSTLIRRHRYIIVSFARSGNSPESLATYMLIRKHFPEARHIIITCNPEGALVKRAADDGCSLCIVLPDETNDRSLVMTSSFTTMALTAAGLGCLDSLDEFERVCSKLAAGARRILHTYGSVIRDFAGIPFSRACFLGSNTLYGAMQECQLKMVEMTDGRVAARFESYLGLRHGPRVFVNSDCVVFASLSSNPSVQRYEMDMLRDLKAEKQGSGTMVVCAKADDEVREFSTHALELYRGEEPVDDDFRIMTDIVAGQILATFKSLSYGLKLDSPSVSDTISRVVRGVVIYEA